MTAVAPHRRRASLLAVALAAALLVAGALRALPAGAAPSPATGPVAAWLAAQVNPDGSVDNPSSGSPSPVWTVNVALGLAAAGTEPAALEAAMASIEADVDAYVIENGSDSAGRLAYLVLLADVTGRDPFAFGVDGTNLVDRLVATYGQDEPGLFDSPDSYSSTTFQSLALLALSTAGVEVPQAAIDWLVDQQCLEGEGPEGVAGGWQGYRAAEGDGLADCVVDGDTFLSPDSNNTAFALQALAAVGGLGSLDGDALAFLAGLQGDTGPAAGGFAFSLLDPTVDPNSTAVAIQALLAAGQDIGAWAAGGGTPMTSLESWVIASGADAGALSSPYSAGIPDLYATAQGVWGLAEQPFPFQPVPTPPPTTTTTTTTVVPDGGDGGTGGGTGGGASPVAVTPRFTG